MINPKVGDTVRVERSYCGSDVHFTDHKLEELNFCLGFYGEVEGMGPKTPCNFTPLSELWDRHPDATNEYWPNHGAYPSKHVNKFEIISA